ncbi:MAG TPA: HAD domain-containing protein [Bradyrhizobium sp.]|nr:HAD domain-containing protein [Bradyrhizobium sp.]
MKVIFLDIDGVLNCSKTPNPRGFPYIVDRKLLARFKKLLDRTGAKVVLSSTWRCDPVGLFAAKHYGVPFMDVCPDRPKNSRRGELLAWLKAHPTVTRYIVLDDEDDDLDDFPLFQPSATTGLTMEIVRAAEKYLNGDTEQDMRASAVVRLGQNIHALFKRNKS